MLTLHVILASAAVAALALRPRSGVASLGVAAIGVVEIVLGAPAAPALAVIVPLLAFLAAALTLAARVERSGLTGRAAGVLAARANGSALRLYVYVCVVCALLTSAVSLDGAVVLLVPLVRALARDHCARFAPLFLGAVAVANAVSIAVPQGNPTNLVVMSRLELSPGGYLA